MHYLTLVQSHLYSYLPSCEASIPNENTSLLSSLGGVPSIGSGMSSIRNLGSRCFSRLSPNLLYVAGASTLFVLGALYLNTKVVTNNNTIHVFQKNWAFTSSDSKSPQIKTGSFGPCYVVTFTSGKFAAMAHIDDNTNVDSITAIFDKFLENSVSLKDVKVTVLGGWKEHPESFTWGQKVVKKIKESGFENVNTENMHCKKVINATHLERGIRASEIPLHYYYGAVVDSSSGKTVLLEEFQRELNQEQHKQSIKFAENYPDLNTELPLTQVSSPFLERAFSFVFQNINNFKKGVFSPTASEKSE